MSRAVLVVLACLLPIACSEPEPPLIAIERPKAEAPAVASQAPSDCEPETATEPRPPHEFIPPWEGRGVPRETPTRIAEPVEPIVPEYSEAARKARVQGFVIVTAGIAKDGTVVGAYVLKGLPFCLNSKALEAVERAEFRPALVGDRPIDSVVNLTVQFQLDE
jgi:TonB family protein